MPGQPEIDRQLIFPILDGVRDVGGSVDSLLEESGLLAFWLDRESEAVPEPPVWKLFECAAHALDLPEIGLHTGSRLRVRDLGQLGIQLEQSLTLFHCLNQYIVNRYSSHARFWLDQEAEGGWFCRAGIDLIEDGRDYVEQFTLQLMMRLVQLATGSCWRPARIRVQAANSRSYRDFGDFNSTEIHEAQRTTAVWIASDDMLKLVHRTCEARLIELIRQKLTIGVEERPNLALTAEELGTSKRSLQRKLHSMGLDWSRLLDQVRLQRAINLLESTDMKLVEVAYDCGYTDSANFGRAFYRWTGVAPGTYRRHLRAN